MNSVAAIQAIVLADHVYRDERTGKHVVAGTFHQINVPEVPTTLSCSVGVFIAFTGLDGDLTMGCQFLTPDQQVLLDMEPLEIACESHSEHFEIGLELPPLPLPKLGLYTLRVTTNGSHLAEAPVHVVLAEGAGG